MQLFRGLTGLAMALATFGPMQAMAELPFLSIKEKASYDSSVVNIGTIGERQASLWGMAQGYSFSCEHGREKYKTSKLVKQLLELDDTEVDDKDWLTVATISANSVERLIAKSSCEFAKIKILPPIIENASRGPMGDE